MLNIMFTLPQLPYDHTALEPAIDAETMRLHHGLHHQGYVDKLNAAMETLATEQPELNAQVSEVLDRNGEEAALRFILTGQHDFGSVGALTMNNAGGHLNHSFFWLAMRTASEDNQPSERLREMLSVQFGSLDNFKTEFEQAALSRFGSGWAWLVKNDSGQLSIISTANQDSPISLGLEPVLGLDVWEHAYYLRYHNRRADYAKNWWSVVNWARVESIV